MLSIDECRAYLVSRGYVEISEFSRLQPGVRVCYSSEQSWRARWEGTGTVIGVFRDYSSVAAALYRRPDVEVIIEWDDAERPPAILADHGIAIAWRSVRGSRRRGRALFTRRRTPWAVPLQTPAAEIDKAEGAR